MPPPAPRGEGLAADGTEVVGNGVTATMGGSVGESSGDDVVGTVLTMDHSMVSPFFSALEQMMAY